MKKLITRFGVALLLALLASGAAVAEDAAPKSLSATYDDTQPGADDARVKEGFAAYQAGEFKKAYDIWLPLAEAGNAEAQFRVGRLYDVDGFPDASLDDVITWYERSAEMGHLNAMFNLGLLYGTKVNHPETHHLALKYYRMAAVRCDTQAQNNMGILLARTPTNIRSYSEAHMWLLISGLLGHPFAEETSQILRDKLSSQKDMDEGKEKAQAWLEIHTCALPD